MSDGRKRLRSGEVLPPMSRLAKARVNLARRVAAKRGSTRGFSKPSRGDPGTIDVASATRVADTTGTIFLLNTIPTGTTQVTRVGKKVNMTNLYVQGRIAAGSAGSLARGTLVIIYDKRPTGTLPAITDVYDTINSNSFRNNDNWDRFEILHRHTYAVNGASAGTVENGQWDIDIRVPIKREVIFKSAGTGAIADQERGSLIAITMGDVAAGTGAPIFTFGTRLSYQDLH